MNNERQLMTAIMEEIRKRGRPWRRWTGEFEKDLNIMGIKNLHTVATDWNKWRPILEARVCSSSSSSGSSRVVVQ